VTIIGTELVKTENTKGLNDQTQWLHRHFVVRAKLKSCKTNGVEQAFFCQSNKGAVYLDISSYIHIKDIDLQRFLQPINLKNQTDSCSLDVAKEVALAEILDSAETYNGQCILTTGYADERAIFTKRPSKGEDLKAIRMGLYTNKYNRKLLLGAGKLTKVKILGVVGMCKDLYGPTTVEVFASKDKVEAITLPFVFGYCHYVVGPFINSVTIQKLET
jgi:hypothetical protein